MMTAPGNGQLRKNADRPENNDIKFLTFPDIIPGKLRQGGIGLLDPMLRTFAALRLDYDVFFADSGFRPASGPPGWINKALRGTPYICEWWDLNGRGGQFDARAPLSRYTIGLLDSFFEKLDKHIADGVVCLSSYLQQKCLDMGFSFEKTVVIHGGADVESIRFMDKEKARRQLGLKENMPLLGFSGMNRGEIQNLIPFLLAVKTLKKEFPALRWFSTGGALSPGLLKSSGLGEEYMELGWVPYEKYALYLSSTDILLCPLQDTIMNRARWPNKLGDYLAAGRPIITTSVGEIEYFTKQYPDVLSTTKWNTNAIYEAIRDLLADLEKARALGAKLRIIAETDYSWRAQARKLETFLLRRISC
jgi:glycosyltransferase involved in cell wall biosynthesis